MTDATRARFTAGNIAGASVLYTGAVDVDFTGEELADIEAFVLAGGGLVVQRDWGAFYPAADPLADRPRIPVGTHRARSRPRRALPSAAERPTDQVCAIAAILRIELRLRAVAVTPQPRSNTSTISFERPDPFGYVT